MKKNWLVFSFIIAVFLLLNSNGIAKSADLGKLMAYPNPFNPQTQTLFITKENKVPFTVTGKVRFMVYDINGKKIYEDTQTGTLKWHGFTTDTQRVAPGLYYIRVIEEELTATEAAQGNKVIKVLVK